MTRHHAEQNIDLLLTRNLPFDSHARRRSLTVIIPLHCLWAKLNNRKLSNMKHQNRLKVLQKLYIISNVIFRPHWLKPFSN